MLAIPFISIMAIVPLALLVWALVDALQRPAAAWDAAGQQQIVWLIVIVFVGFIGPILYLVIARPRLDASAPTAADRASDRQRLHPPSPRSSGPA